MQVLEEQIAIHTSNTNELAIADCEDILERLPCGDRRSDTSSFRDKCCFVVAGLISSIRILVGLFVLDLVEQTLPFGALLRLVGAFDFVELPIAAQEQKCQHLYAKDDGTSGKRGSKVLYTLIFRPRSRTRPSWRRRRVRIWRVRHGAGWILSWVCTKCLMVNYVPCLYQVVAIEEDRERAAATWAGAGSELKSTRRSKRSVMERKERQGTQGRV